MVQFKLQLREVIMFDKAGIIHNYFEDNSDSAEVAWAAVGADSVSPGLNYLITEYAIATSVENAREALVDLYTNKDSGFESFWEYADRYGDPLEHIVHYHALMCDDYHNYSTELRNALLIIGLES